MRHHLQISIRHSHLKDTIKSRLRMITTKLVHVNNITSQKKNIQNAFLGTLMAENK